MLSSFFLYLLFLGLVLVDTLGHPLDSQGGTSSNCPDTSGWKGARGWSEETGCLFADSEATHNYANSTEALEHCKEILGADARLVEILSPEAQTLATNVLAAAESMIEDFPPVSLPYWWSGLTDLDDDGDWSWEQSGEATYTNWNSAASPSAPDSNCMLFLSAKLFSGEWINVECEDVFLSYRPFCQLV